MVIVAACVPIHIVTFHKVEVQILETAKSDLHIWRGTSLFALLQLQRLWEYVMKGKRWRKLSCLKYKAEELF